MKVKGIGIALLAGGLLLTGCSASSNKSDSNTLVIGTEGKVHLHLSHIIMTKIS